MEYGICLLPVIPLRKEPDDRSEMLTQLIFGETARIFEVRQKWLSVETDLDQYPGWVDAKQLTRLPRNDYERFLRDDFELVAAPFVEAEIEGGGISYLPAGSSVRGLFGGLLDVCGEKWRIKGKTKPFVKGSADEIVRSATGFLNAPYLWGGRTYLGVDCSGLTQMAYRLNGINIPRDASAQADVGESVSFLSEAQPGDLAFFDDDQGKIIHVGMIIDTHTIIHASGKVRMDTLDHQGIFNKQTRTYSHRLRLIRRMVK